MKRIPLFTLALLAFCNVIQAELTIAPDGAQLIYDGTYYHYRSAQGAPMFSLWVPPGGQPMRGIIISGHGGGTGDSRPFTRELNFRIFASKLGFGILGLQAFSGREAYEKGSVALVNGLNAMADLGINPELRNVPFIVWGSSNGGSTSYGLANALPERTIAFCVNVSYWFIPEVPGDAVLKVPALFAWGPQDPFLLNNPRLKRSPADCDAFQRQARARGAHWAWFWEEGKGHEDGLTMDIFVPFFEYCIALRVPANSDARSGPVKLNDIPLESGWLADTRTSRNGFAEFMPYADYKGPLEETSWLPNKALALGYAAIASWGPRVSIELEGMPRLKSAYNLPENLLSVAGHILPPGSPFIVNVDWSISPWKSITLYEGDKSIGVRTPGDSPAIHTQVPTGKGHVQLAAVAELADGTKRISPPYHFLVGEKPDTRKSLLPTIPGTLQEPVKDGSDFFENSIHTASTRLTSHALTAAQEKSIRELHSDAPFWKSVPSWSRVELQPGTHSRALQEEGTRTEPTASFYITSAHSRAGLYLLCKAIDDTWTPPSEESEFAHLHAYDAVDFLISAQSLDQIYGTPITDAWVNLDWGIPLSSRQFQFSLAGGQVSDFVRISNADPFEMRYYSLTREDTKIYFPGLNWQLSLTSEKEHTLQIFIPWNQISREGLPHEPSLGSELAFTFGYIDRDADKTGELRWLGKQSPWSVKPKNILKSPAVWGEIIIGPGITNSSK